MTHFLTIIAAGSERSNELPVALRDQLRAPNRLQFFGRNIDLQAPLGEMRPFARKIGSSET